MPPEITQAIITAAVVIIGAFGAMVTGFFTYFGLRARADAKIKEAEAEDRKTAAAEKALAIKREELFLQQVRDQADQIRVVRADNQALIERLRKVEDNYAEEIRRGNAREDKVAALVQQLEQVRAELSEVKEARAAREAEWQRERERHEQALQEERSLREAAEKRLEAAQKRIEELEEKVKFLEQRLDPVESVLGTRELPAAVSPEVQP